MSDGITVLIAVSFAALILALSGCSGVAKDEPTGQNSVCMTEEAYMEELIRKVPIGDFCKLDPPPACIADTCTACQTTRCCAEFTVYYASATTADQYAPIAECVRRECEICP